jgi:hypothetical protein
LHPQGFLRLRGQFTQITDPHFNNLHSPCQRFGGLARKLWRGTPENQESGRFFFAISQYAQDGKETGLTLCLINHYQAMKPLQGRQRIFHDPGHHGIFKVEVLWMLRGDHLPG